MPSFQLRQVVYNLDTVALQRAPESLLAQSAALSTDNAPVLLDHTPFAEQGLLEVGTPQWR